MSAIAERRKRRMVVAVIASIASLVSLPAGLVLGANALLNDSGGNKVDDVPAIQVPASSLHLWAVASARNELASVVLVALTPEGRGGTVMSFPVGAAADVDEAEAPRRIADSWISGGLAALRADVEDLFNVTLDSADDFTAAELATVLSPVGTQPVTIPQAVWDGGETADAVQVLEAGSLTVGPEQIATGLAAVQVSVPESYRLAQVKALWSGVARAGVEAPPSTATTTVSSAVTEAPVVGSADSDPVAVLSSLLAGRVDVWQVSSSRLVDAQRNPAGLDLYSVDGGEALMVLASVAPGALTTSNSNISVMVDIPFDDAALAREAVTRLAYLGANVVIVRRSVGMPEETTVVHFSDPLARTEVESYTSLMGPLEFVETDEIISGVDARIVIGYDFTSHLGTGGGTVASTTTTVAG